MKHIRIAIIIPYFGKWPEWIDLYFYSCSQNKGIDWYFFTDCVIPSIHSNNLLFESITFLDYCNNAGKALNLEFKPKSSYKLCGLRPFEGYIHRNLLSEYDFWGWGDVDVVWGDLSKFYTQELFNKYDVFSTHADRLSGHLAIIRNKPKYNEACFRIRDWQKKLESQEAIALDEQDFTWLLFPKLRWVSKFYSKVILGLFNWRDAWVLYYRLMPHINFFLRIKARKLYFKEQHTTPILGNDGLSFEHDSEEWIYKNGKVFNIKNNKEYIYLHFMIFKKNSFRDDYYWKENYYKLPKGYEFSNGVIINIKGIFPIN